MAISRVKTQELYQGDGSTVQWDIGFDFEKTDDIKIYVINADDTRQEITEDYSIVKVGNNYVLNYPLQNNGASPLASGKKLLIYRVTEKKQELSIDTDTPPKVLEGGYDKAMLIAQELAEQIDRAVKFPRATSSAQTDAAAYLASLNTAVTTAQSAATSAQAAAATAAADTQAAIDSHTDSAVNTEKSDRQAADATLQNNIDAEASARATADALKLDISTAASTYLTQSNASTTYLSKTDAASTYLTQTNAAATYLTQTNAGTTYATQSALTSGLAGKQDTLTTAQQAAVDSGVTSSTISQVQTNKEDIAALDAELDEDRPWQKPASWIDIRSGAISNSVYFLVAHSADYATYPNFGVYATVSNSGTYDVFIDGVKKATTASGSDTTLNWQTLALTSGYDVTYPANLRTHIVRVTPTNSSHTLTRVQRQQTEHYGDGILWIHFTNANFLEMPFIASDAGILESVTGLGGEIRISNAYYAFRNALSLRNLDTFVGNPNSTTNMGALVYHQAYKSIPITKVKFKDINNTSIQPPFMTANIKKIIFENSKNLFTGYMFIGNTSLKELPSGLYFDSSITDYVNLLRGCIGLQNVMLDMSAATTAKRIKIGAESSTRVDGLKGLTVAPEAPFDYATSPQLDVSYTGLDRTALVTLFNSMPTVTGSQTIDITGATGAADLTADDLAIATGKGWSVTR